MAGNMKIGLKRDNKIENKQATSSTKTIAFWYVASNLLVSGFSIITTPIFTRILTKTEVGNFGNFTAWFSILTILVTLNLYSTIARAKYDFNEEMDQYLSSILILTNLVTLAFYLVVELFSPFFIGFFSMEIRYIRILFVYLLFSPAFTFLQMKLRIYKQFKFVVFFSIFSSVMNVLVSITLVLLLENKFMGRVLGTVAPITSLNILIWIYIMWKGRSFSFRYVKYALLISVPLIPHALAGNLLNTSDRVMIKQICGAEDAAIYSIAYTTSMLVQILWSSMNQAWSPWLFDHIFQKDYVKIKEKSRLYLLLFMGIAMGIMLVVPEVILVMAGAKYAAAKYVMPPVIVGMVFQFVYSMYVNLEMYQKKTIMISFGTLGAAAINIGLNYLLIPKFGYIAAAYTTLVGYACLMLFHFFIVKLSHEFDGIYDDKFHFAMLGLIFVFHLLCMYLYQFVLIRYVVVVIYGFVLMGIAYKYRDNLLFFLKKVPKKKKEEKL